jgi:hypothetical protein
LPRAGALNPLAHEISWNLAAGEPTVPGVAYTNRCAGNERPRIEKSDALSALATGGAPVEPRLHERTAVGVERRKRVERHGHVGGQDVVIGDPDIAAPLHHSSD